MIPRGFWTPAPAGVNLDAEAADYMSARAESRARFAALVHETGSAEAARAEIAARRTKRQAREQARVLGLAYWPALLRDERRPRVDPAAYVAAERVLSPRHGYYGDVAADGRVCRGGWDSKGHYGIAPWFVAQMWLAAGCRDSPKFRAQVRARMVARKGDSLPLFLAFVRGKRWADRWHDRCRISRKALAALGRLSPELRHAAMRGVGEDAGDRILPNGQWRRLPVRIRDLNWAEVQRIQALRFDGSRLALPLRAVVLPPRPAAVVLGLPHSPRMAHPIKDDQVPELCPAYPLVCLSIAARISAGESPVSISGGVLTRQEAHRWLSAGGPSYGGEGDIRDSVLTFLAAGLPLEGHRPRNVAVVRWLMHVQQRGAWSALLKIERHPDGRTIRRMDVLDEIDEPDLDRGVATGVERAFENAARRLAAVDAGDTRIIGSNPFGRLPKPMALLRSHAALAHEGRVMVHCVAGYGRAVAAGECYIISVASRHGRSTVELRPGPKWLVAQHRGRSNGPPPARHAALVTAWLNRLNRRVQRRAA